MPGEDGEQDTPAGSQVLCLIIAVRSNSPMGIFSPGFNTIADYFKAMCEELESDPTVYGFLGASSWLSNSDRCVSSEYMSVMYFESSEALHAYAHGPRHTETMNWWTSTAKDHDHLGIMHEVFAAPKNGWEGVYINYHPAGLNAAYKQVDVKTEQGSEKVWKSLQVEGRGPLRYSRGRMGRVVPSQEKTFLDNLTNVA